jgi:hypothetical protein
MKALYAESEGHLSNRLFTATIRILQWTIIKKNFSNIRRLNWIRWNLLKTLPSCDGASVLQVDWR